MPKPTTQASKLMQTRRKVSASTRRISHAPSGTPIEQARQDRGCQRAGSATVNRPA